MTEHVSSERLLDYLAGLLGEADEEVFEEHLFSCRPCALEAEKLFGLLSAVHRAVSPVVTAERFQVLEREGRIAEVKLLSPGRTVEVRFPPAEKLLLLRLGGSDLSRARRVDVDLLDLEGRVVAHFDDVPFDSARGEVLLACQRHFADLFPHDMTCRLERVVGESREEANRYTVLHRV